jgi:hypothetical protein
MKPDCRRVLSQIASYSVEELSTDDASAFTRHLDDCPPCQGQWLLFEKTLTTLSETPEAKIEVERSRQMWVACMEHAKAKTPALASHPALANQQSPEEEVMSQPSRSVSHGAEGDRRSSFSSGSRSSGWLQDLKNSFSPQFGYAVAGFSALVLGTSYFLSPAIPLEQSRVAMTLPAMPTGQSQLVSFQVPPHATTGMLDYHAAMSFEPFSDHVAPTLVSYTATQP